MKYDVSIIYVYYNTPSELKDSVNSLLSGIGTLRFEVIIINNASPQPIPKDLPRKNIIQVNNKENKGYGAGLNQGVEIANGEYILLANPDTLFSPNAIERMVERIKQDKKIGILGPQVLAPDNSIARTISGNLKLPDAIFIFSFLGKLFSNHRFIKNFWLFERDVTKEQEVSCIGGVCMLMKKEVFEKVHGFDEQFFLYFEEIDLSMRVRKAGYKNIYFPHAKIMHFVSQSERDEEKTEKEFEKSRFKFFRKYYGIINAFVAETFLRLCKTEYIFLTSILIVSIFLNVYKLDSLMLFIGDMGRDYLAARDMIFTRTIPLVGIQSSVVWLHQGPLSIYFIAFTFLISHFSPIAPAVFYALLGVITTYLLYKIGKEFFNKKIGLLSALFFATSPLFIINVRMPYHTSSIPFFTSLLLLFTYRSIQKQKNIPFVFFLCGVLLLLELSNAILLPVIFIFFLITKTSFHKRETLYSLFAFLAGITPFILYDFKNNFVQTIGFPLWIINRIRLFFGVTTSGNSTTGHFSEAMTRVFQEIVSALFPASQWVVTGILILIVIVIFSRIQFITTKNKALLLLLLSLIIPICGYLVHAAPGMAYFPVLFPTLSLLVAYTVGSLPRVKVIIMLFISLCLFNGFFTIYNEYFLVTKNRFHSLPPSSYVLGSAIELQSDIAKFIVADAKGKTFTLKGGGFVGTLATGVDNYRYLVWYYGGKENKNSKLQYVIYEDKNAVKKEENIVFNNKFLYVVKK